MNDVVQCPMTLSKSFGQFSKRIKEVFSIQILFCKNEFIKKEIKLEFKDHSFRVRFEALVGPLVVH